MMRVLSLLPVLCAAAALGCGGGTGTLSGTVKFKSALLRQGTVTVVNEKGFFATGTINADGTYRIEGCPTGKVKIGVDCPNPDDQQKLKDAANDPNIPRRGGGNPQDIVVGDKNTYIPIPDIYKIPDDSGIVFEVSSGENTFDIDLQ